MLKSARISSLLAGILFIAAPSFSQNALITSVAGSVEARLSKDAQWQTASKGAQLSEGAAVRTGDDGRAILLFKNGTRIWIKEKSTLDLSEQKDRSHQILLRGGSIKARVPHLKFKERFRLRTPAAVVAVRGTVLVLETDSSGEPSVDVLFGEVRLGRAAPESDNETDKVYIPQGNNYLGGRIKLLTREQEVLGLEDWSPGLTPDERRKDLIESMKKRNDVREYAALTRAAESEISESQQQVKEEDFAAGRTLVDVHGNVVRVDQRLDRPDNKTLQVVNVVKRSGYASRGFRKYAYNGSGGARLDSVSTKIEFNIALPDNLSEFPGFFSENDNKIEVERSEVVFANMGDSDEVFTVAMMGLRNPDRDDVDVSLFIGTLQTASGRSGKTRLFQLRQQADGTVPGLTKFIETPDTSEIKNEGTDELYGNFAKLWQESGDATNKLWLASEFFVINNAGKVRNLKEFTDGSVNFESLFKDTAAQLGIFAKTDVGAPSTVDATNFSGGNAAKKNIDVVIIPDIFVSVVKSLASSLDSLSKSVDSSFSSVSNAK